MESDVKSSKSKVECVCPLCNETHYLNIFWTGTLPARKYHDHCKKICCTIDDIEIAHIEKRSGQDPYYLERCR